MLHHHLARKAVGERKPFFKKKIILTYIIQPPVNSSPTTRDPPQSSPSSSHQLQSEGSSRQTQFQFQDPVVPEDHITSPIRPRELSIVHVKWDSERKRRQGYFSQEEGAEKSPFRHYNKANCDLDS